MSASYAVRGPAFTLHLSCMDREIVPTYSKRLLIFGLSPTSTNQKITSLLHEALQSTVHTLPFLAGLVTPISESENGHSWFRKITSGGAARLDVKDLSQDISLDELRVQGFAQERLDADRLCPLNEVAYYNSPQLDVCRLQANFVDGGLLLTVSILHVVCDGVAITEVLKVFARKLREAQLGRPQPDSRGVSRIVAAAESDHEPQHNDSAHNNGGRGANRHCHSDGDAQASSTIDENRKINTNASNDVHTDGTTDTSVKTDSHRTTQTDRITQSWSITLGTDKKRTNSTTNNFITDRTLLFHSKGLHGNPSLHPAYTSGPHLLTRKPPTPLAQPLLSKTFRIPSTSLAVLKSTATTTSNHPQIRHVSTQDALAALLWRTTMLARHATGALTSPSYPTTFNQPIDFRRHLSLPHPYHGNAVYAALSTLPVSTLLQPPRTSLPLAASAIRANITAVTPERVRDLFGLLERPDRKWPTGMTALTGGLGRDAMLVTSYYGFQMYDESMDFGPAFGGGMEAMRLPSGGLMMAGLGVVLPRCRDGGVEVVVTEGADVMEALEGDEVFMGFVRGTTMMTTMTTTMTTAP